MWSTGEGNGKPLQYSCLENPMNHMKRQNDRIMKEELSRSVGAQYATGDQWRNSSRKNKGMEPKQKQYPVMARMNVDILGISELKWTGMGEFNSDDHYIYYCQQESLRRNGVAIMVNKRVRNAVLRCNLKHNRMISVVSKANHSISQ